MTARENDSYPTKGNENLSTSIFIEKTKILSRKNNYREKNLNRKKFHIFLVENLIFFITLFRRKSEFSPPHCRYESIVAIFMAVGPLFRRFLDSGRLDHPQGLINKGWRTSVSEVAGRLDHP